MRPSYKKAVSWIAENDEPTESDPVVVSEMISVSLVADLFDKDPLRVAADVISCRRKRKILLP
jgi:hypothetical protein